MPMSRTAVLYALAALACALLAVALPDRLVPPDDNFRVVSSVEEVFRAVVLGSFRMLLGAFAGLALAAGLATLFGAGGARRPVALVVSALLAAAVIAFSGVVFRGFAVFPAEAPLEVRHRWATAKLGPPYAAAVAWGAGSTAIRAACGEALRIAPAPATRNAARIDAREWTFTFTLDVEGEKGRGRLVLSGVLPLEPAGAPPAIGTALLTAGGVPVPLDSAGRAASGP